MPTVEERLASIETSIQIINEEMGKIEKALYDDEGGLITQVAMLKERLGTIGSILKWSLPSLGALLILAQWLISTLAK